MAGLVGRSALVACRELFDGERNKSRGIEPWCICIGFDFYSGFAVPCFVVFISKISGASGGATTLMKASMVIFLLLFILSCLLTSSSCSSRDTDYTIKLYGTPGLGYLGHYSWQRGNSTVQTKASVSGMLPNEYEVTGFKLSVYFSISAGSIGILKVEIIKDDAVIASAESTSADKFISLEVP